LTRAGVAQVALMVMTAQQQATILNVDDHAPGR
jgi:hypothetical protein